MYLGDRKSLTDAKSFFKGVLVRVCNDFFDELVWVYDNGKGKHILELIFRQAHAKKQVYCGILLAMNLKFSAHLTYFISFK